MKLFNQSLHVLNVGLPTFLESLKDQSSPVMGLDWTPPNSQGAELIEHVQHLDQAAIEAANRTAFERINQAEPNLVDVVYAHEVLDLPDYTIGHAGPPLEWAQMCGPLQGAVLGAIVYEGWADSLEQAERLVGQGKIRFVSNHSMNCVAPMTGMITRSMPLWQVRNQAFGNLAYAPFNEGLGKVMRFGANGPEVIERLRWLADVLAPAMKAMLKVSGPISLKVLMSKALVMGDEMHQRNAGATAQFVRDTMKYLVAAVTEPDKLQAVVEFITGNDQFFLNLAMVAGKAIMDPVNGIEHSTIVTAMSRNGTDFGIQVSGLGHIWYTAPVNQPQGLYFPGYSADDANPDIGDSAIVETIGLGGFAMATAPAVVRFVGAKSVADAIVYSKSMYEITYGKSPHFILPALDFSGAATGIDIRQVVATGIEPVINTGMAHKQAGIGQVGAGIVTAPYHCFYKALLAFYDTERRL